MQKTCFVLLPGSGMSDWLWTKMTPFLDIPYITIDRRLKYNSPSNPMKENINDCVDYAMEIINSSEFNTFIIVAHNGAGLLASRLAARLGERACHTVYIAANIPAEGMTALDNLPDASRRASREAAGKLVLANSIPHKLMEPFVRDVLCNDCDEETTKFVLEQRFLPEPLCSVNETALWKDYPDILQTYIVAEEDKVLTPEKQLEMARTLSIKEIIRVNAGDMMMLSHPDETADILNSIAFKYVKNTHQMKTVPQARVYQPETNGNQAH